MIADRFGVVTVPDEIRMEIMRRWRLVNIPSDCITSVRPINIPVPELHLRKEELEAKFIEIARKQIEEEGAQAIVPGCGLYLPVLGPNSRERLEGALGVPVLPGAPLLVKFAEMMVNVNLRQSRKAYP